MNTSLQFRSLFALGAIVLLAAGLRFYGADHSLRLDELTTAWVIDAGKGSILERSTLNNLSPVYYFVTAFATDVFGINEIGLRFWSLAAGVALIPLGFLTAQRLTSSRLGGLVAAILLAIDPVSLEFAQDARPYALVEFFALAAVLAFSRVLERPSWSRRAGLVTSGIVLFYLHYTTALFLFALLFYYTLVFLKDQSTAYRPYQIAADGLLLAVACLPALAQLKYLAGNRTVLGQFIQKPKLEEIVSVFPLTSFFVIPVLAAAAIDFVLAPKNRPGREEPELDQAGVVALLACWFSIPVLIAWTATRFDLARIYNKRYIFSAWPAALVFFALLLVRLKTPSARFVMLLSCLAVVCATEGPARRLLVSKSFTSHGVEQWREAIHDLNAKAASDSLPLLVHSGLVEADWIVSPHDELLTSYCLAPVNTVYRVSGKRSFHVVPFSKLDTIADDLSRDLLSNGGTWVLWRGAGEANFLDNLNRICRRTRREISISDLTEFQSVRVFRIRIDESVERATPRPSRNLGIGQE
jgi:Dolichyl-phosphate-mannose-protein mannosyltransferase